MLRPALQLLRVKTTGAARVAGRLSAATRYVVDLVLWSRIAAHSTELSRHSQSMTRRGVSTAAPVMFMTGAASEADVWENAFQDVYRVLLANLQVPDLISRRRYARPSPAFQGVYLWDSAFIAQVWKPWDIGVAIDTCLAPIDLADADGRIPHVTTHFIESAFTQPPLLAWSLWNLFDWSGGDDARAALREAFPRLVQYNDWLCRHRQNERGLFFWAHPYESGVENAPRFSSRDERVLSDTTRLSAPDFSSYVILQCESLAAIALELGDQKQADRMRERAGLVRNALDVFLWDEEEGVYFDRDTASGQFVRSITIASLMPLWAGVPDADRAARILDRVVDTEAFGTRLPLPSVSRSDPEFAKDMWRGSTWLNTAYAVLLGLERYGFREAAAEVAYRLVDGVYRTHAKTHRLYEFYDPERYDILDLHRKKGNHWKHLTLGSKPRAEFVGWTGLVNTIVIENILGYSRDRGRAYLRPNIARCMEGRSLIVRLPEPDVTIEAERLRSGDTQCVVRDTIGVRRARIRNADRVYVDEMPLESDR